MIAQIATLVCAAAMALSLSVEAGSFFHSPTTTTTTSSADDGPSVSDDDESAVNDHRSP